MDEYFKLPEDYACLAKNGSQIYAYPSDFSRRDTFEFDNFRWLKVGSSTSFGSYSPSVCLPSTVTYLVPDSVAGSALVSATLIGLALCAGLFKVFSR